jgi:uncharacterized protein YjbJ (UPF0337 family)
MASSNEPSQLNGQFQSVKGTAEEIVSILYAVALLCCPDTDADACTYSPPTTQIGNLTGSTEWQASGKKDHAAGESEIKAAQAKGYAEGLTDQVGGYKDSIVGAVTGDKAQQTAGNIRNEAGAAKKEANLPS